MADMNEPLQAEPPVDSWDDVPEQRAARAPLLPKGLYEFQIPHNLQPKHFEEMKSKEMVKGADGKETPKTVWRQCHFSAELPLVVTRDTTPEQTYSGQIFEGNLSTLPRKRFGKRKGDPVKMVSDAVYFYKDALKGSTVGFKPSDTEKLIDGICKIGAGKKFQAQVIWQVGCSKSKVRRVIDSAGQNVEDPEGKHGCGKFYRDAPSEDFVCECGASLRVFPELANYKPSEEE